MGGGGEELEEGGGEEVEVAMCQVPYPPPILQCCAVWCTSGGVECNIGETRGVQGVWRSVCGSVCSNGPHQ